MRDIKFRAWDKEKNKMIYSDETYPGSIYKFGFEMFNNYKLSLSKCTDRSGRIFNVDNEGVLIFNPVDADIMQYTGLKDKNGKEIYEGDILLCCELEINGTVFFNEGCFRVQWENCIEDLYENCDVYEVIGNIYENPELLK
ncbi:MAG: hypothetical protein KIB00_18040 [Paeniclostridium sordellii]|nr:hypothetical protein [Paeniclostridium sordellii]